MDFLKMDESFPQDNNTTPIEPSKKGSKAWLVFLILGLISMLGGVACVLVVFLLPKEELPDLEFPAVPSAKVENKYYSHLTGLPVADEAAISAPTYCIQTPNGTDGARPQAGLNEAGVIFEAIAEAGITRFAAIYQNPSAAVIGPIRSLRLYYLQWDTPFDCTIVHAGGADDAIAAVRAGGYKDLSENYYYMYRGTYGARRWNNLFTTSSYLRQMNADWGYGNSNVVGFTRMTPAESLKARVDVGVKEKLVITEPSVENLSKIVAAVPSIAVRFGYSGSFNVNYSYDGASNTYLRSYESGDAHDIYDCPAEDLGEKNPESVCTLKQLAPSVVVAMVVEEKRAWDNYHEDITTLGSGKAYIFQNGGVTVGTWNKSVVGEQIKFFDESGAEVALAPGQTFVEAVPTYGSVEY